MAAIWCGYSAWGGPHTGCCQGACMPFCGGLQQHYTTAKLLQQQCSLRWWNVTGSSCWPEYSTAGRQQAACMSLVG